MDMMEYNKENLEEQTAETTREDHETVDSSQLEEKARQADEYFTRLQRLQADFDNFRRRVQKERDELTDLVTETVICKFLPVVDNLTRAVANAKTAQAGEAQLLTGLEMINRQMEDVLTKLQVTPISCIGEKFDPQKHEAMMQVQDKNKEDETIVEEFQKGYQLKERIVRPSMVIVVKN
jgi:molecular chaperone GrpE